MAVYDFMTGPLLTGPHRIRKRLLPPLNDRFSAGWGTYRISYRVGEQNRVVTGSAVPPRVHAKRVPTRAARPHSCS